MSNYENNSQVKTPHSGDIPKDQGGERPVYEFDNTPLAKAVDEGRLGDLPDSPAQLRLTPDEQQEHDRLGGGAPTMREAVPGKKYSRRGLLIGGLVVGGGALVGGGAVAAAKLGQRHVADARPTNAAPADPDSAAPSSETSPAVDTPSEQPSASASETDARWEPKYSIEQLAAMDYWAEFRYLPREDQLMYSYELMTQVGTIHIPDYLADYDPTVVEPTLRDDGQRVVSTWGNMRAKSGLYVDVDQPGIILNVQDGAKELSAPFREVHGSRVSGDLNADLKTLVSQKGKNVFTSSGINFRVFKESSVRDGYDLQGNPVKYKDVAFEGADKATIATYPTGHHQTSARFMWVEYHDKDGGQHGLWQLDQSVPYGRKLIDYPKKS